MKKKYILAALALGLSISAKVMAQVPSYVPTSGLVGWYPFTGNANDESTLGTNGTVNAAVLINDRFSSANNAYYFNGVNSNIDLGINSSINSISNAFSISYWINPETNGGVLIANYSSQGVPVSSVWRINSAFNASGNVCFSYLQSTTWQGLTTNPLILNLNTWYHCVYTRSGSTANIYINGVLVSSNTSLANGNLSNPTSPAATTKFGYNFPSSTDYYKGQMDDVGFWNRVLTQSEITALYNSTNCIQPTANITPQGSTNFCQGGFVTLAASTANGNTYQWYVNNNAIGGATSANYVASQSGDYTVVVSNGGCNTTSSAITVTVNTLPSVGLGVLGSFTNINATSIVLSGSPASGTYTGAGVSGNLFNPLNAGLGAHSIFYNYSDGNGCAGTAHTSTIVYDTLGNVCTISVTDTLVINTSVTGINPPNNINTIKVFPNPANDHITINYGNFAMMNGYTLKITNVLGQVIFTTPINQQSSYIDLSTWNGNGIYFVQILDTQNNIIENRKIVLQ